MRLVNIHGPDDVRVDEAPKPEVGPTDVLLKIDACGICGSDLSFAKYGFLREGGAPFPLGHEAAGTIVEAGKHVRDLPVGMRAIINPMGAYDNVIGNGGAEGAFADFLLIRGAQRDRHLLPIPDDMPAERAALVEPLSVALHGVNRSQLQGHEKVVVFGAGPIGLGAVFWLHRRGVENVISVDLSDDRLARATALGATHVINPSKQDLHSTLADLHGSVPSLMREPGVDTDVFFDMAGAPSLMEKTIAIGKYQSRIVLTAVYPAPVPMDLQTMMLKEISITPAVEYPTELPEVLQTLANVDDSELTAYVSHTFTFDQFLDAFNSAKSPQSAKVMVTF